MNASGMSFPQVQVPTISSKNLKQIKSDGDPSIFQTLLSNEEMPDSSLMTLLQENISSQLSEENQEDENILEYPAANNDDTSIADGLKTTTETQPQLLNRVIGNKSQHVVSDQSANRKVDNQFNIDQFIQSIGSNANMRLDNIDQTQANKRMTEMVTRIETLVLQVNNHQDIQKAAPEILELLQKWTAIEKKSRSNQMNFSSSLKKERTNATAILLDVLQSFQKREALAGRQQYSSDAKVTSSDVAKWISNALESQNHTAMDKTAGPQIPSASVTPMSKVEQFVIHVNHRQGSQTVDKQLLEQFQKVIKSSKFMSLPNGTNQLSISLRPENLGDMMVRFTQVQGEMTVKILVSSQAAKEMLETNIHQLRNMFSPQQVVVEKQELNVQQGQQEIQKESKDEQPTEHDQNQSQQDEKQNQDDDFATYFHELLNEKV